MLKFPLVRVNNISPKSRLLLISTRHSSAGAHCPHIGLSWGDSLICQMHFISTALQPPVDQGDHTQTHLSRFDSSGPIIIIIIIIIIIYVTANGLSPGGSGYYGKR